MPMVFHSRLRSRLATERSAGFHEKPREANGCRSAGSRASTADRRAEDRKMPDFRSSKGEFGGRNMYGLPSDLFLFWRWIKMAGAQLFVPNGFGKSEGN